MPPTQDCPSEHCRDARDDTSTILIGRNRVLFARGARGQSSWVRKSLYASFFMGRAQYASAEYPPPS